MKDFLIRTLKSKTVWGALLYQVGSLVTQPTPVTVVDVAKALGVLVITAKARDAMPKDAPQP